MEKIAVDIGATFDSPLGQRVGAGQLVSIILSNVLVIAGIAMVFLLVFGGISIIASAGNDNPEGAAKGKQAATFGVIGFLVIFAAYWIIQILETLTGISIFNPGF